MSNPTPTDQPIYEIRLHGHLDARWQESFKGMVLRHQASRDGTAVTILRGPLADDAALHGLLARIRDLGIPLLLVQRAPERTSETAPDSTS